MTAAPRVNPGGRPREAPDGDARDQVIKLRLTPGEHAAIAALAAEQGLPLSSYAREVLLARATGQVLPAQSS